MQRGGVPLEPVTAVTWTVSASARQSLDAWRSLSGLGGVHVPSGVREVVLRELDEWASDMFGGLDREFASEEAYVLRTVRLFSPQ